MASATARMAPADDPANMSACAMKCSPAACNRIMRSACNRTNIAAATANDLVGKETFKINVRGYLDFLDF